MLRPVASKGSPPRSRTGRIFVENGPLLDDLVEGSPSPSWKDKHYKTKRKDNTADQPATSEHSKLLREQELQRAHQTELMMKQNIQKALERKSERQERLFPVLMSNLDKATSFLEVIDRDINLHDETQQNKVRRQFEDWNTVVHGTIQKKISASVNAMDTKALNKKKNEDYEKFLSITNRKPAIFRDIIIESEYDPLEPNKRCIKAKTGMLKDPVKIDAQKAAAEGAMLGPGAAAGPKHKQLCKDTLDVQLWASGQIEATPYGTFAKIMSRSKGGSDGASSKTMEAAKSATMRSSVVFDHFDYPHGKAAIDKEMPRGKRIHPIIIYANPKKVFGDHVPRKFEEELAQIHPPEGHSYLTHNG